MKNTSIHVANIIKKYGEEPTAENVADYCYTHYKSITGNPTRDRNAEGEFPCGVLDVFEWFEHHFGYDYTLINSYWGNLIG